MVGNFPSSIAIQQKSRTVDHRRLGTAEAVSDCCMSF